MPVNPPTIQHLLPEAAPLITVFAGVPHVQSDKFPPVVQFPFVASKPSLYGKVEIGVPHCAFVFIDIPNSVIKKNIIPVVFNKCKRPFFKLAYKNTLLILFKYKL